MTSPEWLTLSDVAELAVSALSDPVLDARLKGCGNCWRCLRGEPKDRMLVCPDCGNKRCPKASNHELGCTASNEPGQPGSVYHDVGQSLAWLKMGRVAL